MVHPLFVNSWKNTCPDDDKLVMRIIAMSDIHGNLPPCPDGDVLVISGDICNGFESRNHESQASFINGDFSDWIESTNVSQTVVCAGNHDFVFQDAPELIRSDRPFHYLEDSSVEIEGVKFYGTPWQLWLGSWAFNAPEGDAQEEFLSKVYGLIDPDTDVLVSHGPPTGFGMVDSVPQRGGVIAHVGSKALQEAILNLEIPLTVCGHIHFGRKAGIQIVKGDDHRSTVVNAAMVDQNYHINHKPYVFEYDPKTKGVENVDN
jgi:Icc-related predicted phosphoesterase